MRHWTRANKWQKYLALLKDPYLRPYLPETALFSQDALTDFLRRYPFLYLKPIIGTGGYGIIKVTKIGKEYLLQMSRFKRKFSNEVALYQSLTRIMRKRQYMIQQGINLISINKRAMDFRILVLKPYSRWVFMGIIGKIAAPNRIVTNHSRGGRAILINKALKLSLKLKDNEISKMEKDLSLVALRVGNTLSYSFEYVREIGLDVAIDTNRNIWILETNSMPRFNLFRKHPDKKLYPRIYQYVSKIRRVYRKK